MFKKAEKFIEQFEPDILEEKTLVCGYYIALIEDLKQTIIRKIQYLYGEEVIRNNKKCYVKYNSSLPKESDIDKTHFDECAVYIYAAKNEGLISNEDIEQLRNCFEIRNKVAHNDIILFIIEDVNAKILREHLNILKNITCRCKWLSEVESEVTEDIKSFLPNKYVLLNTLYEVLFDDKYPKENIIDLEASTLRHRVFICIFYIAILENMKYNITEKIENFFYDPCFERPVFDNKEEQLKYEEMEKEKICNLKKEEWKHLGKDFAPRLFKSSEMDMINDEHIEFLRSCWIFRNDIVHEMMKYILSGEYSQLISIILEAAFNIYVEWEENWFWNVENILSNEPIPEYVEGVKSGIQVVFTLMYQILFVNREFYNELKEELNKIR